MEEHLKKEMIVDISKNFKDVENSIENLKTVSRILIQKCTHKSKGGETTILILKTGMIEIHELLKKNCIYICANIRKKKDFEKIEKELEVLND